MLQSWLLLIHLTAQDGDTNVRFVFRKSRVALKSGHKIPGLELCAAVLAVEIWDFISAENITFDLVKFYTDSNIL